jgi:putative aldouronate transport system substrate-binding protein
MKKISMLSFTAMISLALVFSGCSSNSGNNSNGKNTTPEATNQGTDNSQAGNNGDAEGGGLEPVNFSFYVNYDWYSPKGLETDAKPLNTYLRDELKVNIEEISSNGNAAQKFGTMIASNDLPDVIQMDRDANFDKLVSEGRLVALDDFINNPKYPHLKELMDDQTLNLLRSSDGKLYGIPNWFGDSTKIKSNAGWIINKKIYKELGSPKLETFDDLYAYLKMVKEKFPDVVPLDTANTDDGTIQVQNFIYGGMGENRIVDFAKSAAYFAYGDFEKMELTSIFEDPAYLDSYKWTSKLFREKLLSQDTFSQKREQFEEKLGTGKIAVAAVYDAVGAADKANQKLQAADPEAGYDFIAPIVQQGVDVGKVSPTSYGLLGWNFNAITTNAENPEAIYAFFDWLLSKEGTAASQYGPPGLYYDLDENGLPVFNDKFKNATSEQKDTDGIGTFYFNLEGSPRWDQMEDGIKARDGGESSWNDQANLFYGQYSRVNGDQFNNVLNIAKGSPEDLAKQQIKQIMEKATSKMVFAKSDEEVAQIAQDAQKQVDAAGYGKVLAAMNKVWKANVERMNGN